MQLINLGNEFTLELVPWKCGGTVGAAIMYPAPAIAGGTAPKPPQEGGITETISADPPEPWG